MFITFIICIKMLFSTLISAFLSITRFGSRKLSLFNLIYNRILINILLIIIKIIEFNILGWRRYAVILLSKLLVSFDYQIGIK